MYIYKTTNIITGKIYIGQSTRESNKSIDYIGSGVYILLSIKKYGKENFIKEILRDNIKNQKLLDKFEEIYIKKFNSTNQSIGYNILTDNKNLLHSEVSREKHKNSIKAYHKTDKAKEGHEKFVNMLKNSVGDKNPFYGKKHSQETKDLMSSKRKGKLCGTEHPNYGKTMSEEQRMLISDSLKGRFAGENHPNYGKKYKLQRGYHFQS